MADHKPRNNSVICKEKIKESARAVLDQASSTTTRTTAAKPAPQKKAPVEKKAVQPAEKPQKKPTVKQLENQLSATVMKADKLVKDIAAAKKEEKKKAPAPKKPQPAIVVKFTNNF